MKSLYNRSNFYRTENVEGVLEKDFATSPINDFVFRRPFSKYRLQYDDWMRPDLMSKRIFGISDYWWIILKVNPELQDIWNDYVVQDEENFPDAFNAGQLINVPSMLDIQELYTFVKNELENV